MIFFAPKRHLAVTTGTYLVERDIPVSVLKRLIEIRQERLPIG